MASLLGSFCKFFFSIFVSIKFFALWDESANVFFRWSNHSSLWRAFKHDIRLIEGCIEIIILDQAMYFRELTMHICLRDLRNETSVRYFANAIEHYINLRKLDISHLKCIHNVSFTKDMLHLRGLCMDKCQNNSPDRELQGLLGTRGFRNWQWACAFSFSHYSSSSCMLELKR